MEHHTKSLGDLGVLKAQLDLYLKGYVVCTLMTEHAPFDLVICKDGVCKTVQVKTRTKNQNNQLVVKFSSYYSDSNGTHAVPVNKDLIDVYCVYNPDTDKCYYFNPKDYNTSLTLRLDKPKNNAVKNINFAEDFLELHL